MTRRRWISVLHWGQGVAGGTHGLRRRRRRRLHLLGIGRTVAGHALRRVVGGGAAVRAGLVVAALIKCWLIWINAKLLRIAVATAAAVGHLCRGRSHGGGGTMLCGISYGCLGRYQLRLWHQRVRNAHFTFSHRRRQNWWSISSAIKSGQLFGATNSGRGGK